MAYAFDLVIGVLAALVAILLLVQLRPSTKYRRFVDGEGNPIDGATKVRSSLREDGSVTVTLDVDELAEEHASFSGTGHPMPEGEGWQPVEDKKNILHYVNATYGAILIVAAACLIIGPPPLARYIAWALFGGAAVLFAFDLRRLIGLIGDWPVHPLNFLHTGFAALGIVAGLRIL